MNIVLNYTDIKYDHIFFNEVIKNTVMENSNFIRLIYSNEYVILNGLFIFIPFTNNDNFLLKPTKIIDDDVIDYITNLEIYILSTYNNNKSHSYKIIDQLKYITSKQYANKYYKNSKLLLKISGIWETNTQIGITHKFIEFNHQ